MKRLEELCELDLLVLIQRASLVLREKTSFVEEDDYEPWDSSDQTPHLHKWASKLSRSATEWIWDRHYFEAEKKVGEFLIKEQ